MNINKVINYTTCSSVILNVRLVIGQSRFKIDSRANTLKVTSNTMSEINNIPRRTGQRFTNIIRSTSSGRAKRHTRDKKALTTNTSPGRAYKTAFSSYFPIFL